MYRKTLKYFGKLGLKYLTGYVAPLKEEITKSNLNILFEFYVGKMLFLSFVAFVAVFLGTTIVSVLILNLDILLSLIGALILSVAVSFAVLTIYHSYPFHTLSTRRNDIEGVMPFAINHMSAIAASGVPPYVVFKLLTGIKEYGEFMHESQRIVRNIDAFGMDLISAIKNVAERTPSEQFRQFLYGIVSNIETGGDLKKFFDNAAKEALFDYRLRREKYLQALSTYADFYTAVLIAAPLFFIAVLAVMGMIGGTVMGLPIDLAMTMGIYGLMPILNMAFIAFIHYTQPNI
ncbi:MAG: type II secretion system F family protein [Candidatus Aenigmatarchaeota archaeon]